MTFIEWFEQSGKTQEELAELLSVSQTAVSSWLLGQKTPHPKTRKRINDVAGRTIVWPGYNVNFAHVFGEIRKAHSLVDPDEKGMFLIYVERYLNGENVEAQGKRSAYLGLMAVKPYLDPYRMKATK